MSKYYCNPINFSYAYQFNQESEQLHVGREAADPSMIVFHGKYYLFPSMTLGYLVSEDMVNWDLKPLPTELPLYDYAPDVRVAGEWMYFCASRNGQICDFYRTRDPESGEFEKIPGTFDFWDPNLFVDDDGRFYFYWGCSNTTPIWGVELDPETMIPKGERIPLIGDGHLQNGYERIGENHVSPQDPEQNRYVKMLRGKLAQERGCKPEETGTIDEIIATLPDEYRETVRNMISDAPYIEGAWMTKHDGKYYLQYACPGTQYNGYADGVYISDAPLGPFTLAENNPYSYSPGGFLPGAGHGSTMEDKEGRWWHTATMRISMNHMFERRIGIWPAGFDKEGNLFCNQRYGDWPINVEKAKDPWAEPDWMLLSYGKKVTASSEASAAANVTDENVQTWWKPEGSDLTPWVMVDLGRDMDVRAAQINFGDDMDHPESPRTAAYEGREGLGRFIDPERHPTRWLLEGSLDGEIWWKLADKRNVDTDLPHDLIIWEEGVRARYLRLSHISLPYWQTPCVSGLRVFGKGEAEKPEAAKNVSVDRYEPMSARVKWDGDAEGYEVLWGASPDKLYHSCRVFGKNEADLRALVAGRTYFFRVDAFNESGITHGEETPEA